MRVIVQDNQLLKLKKKNPTSPGFYQPKDPKGLKSTNFVYIYLSVYTQ